MHAAACPLAQPLSSPLHPLSSHQLERMGHLRAATPEGLAAAVAALDPASLVPYERGNPAGIVRRIGEAVGGAAAQHTKPL